MIEDAKVTEVFVRKIDTGRKPFRFDIQLVFVTEEGEQWTPLDSEGRPISLVAAPPMKKMKL